MSVDMPYMDGLAQESNSNAGRFVSLGIHLTRSPAEPHGAGSVLTGNVTQRMMQGGSKGISCLRDPSTFSEGTWTLQTYIKDHKSVSNHLLRRYLDPQGWYIRYQ